MPVVQTAPANADLVDWLRATRQQFDQALLDTGAVLVQRSGLTDAAGFARAATELCGDLAGYVDGSAERERLGGFVYTSSEYPAAQRISLHNELSYAVVWPRRLCFLCVQPPTDGGETPLVDSRRLLRELPIHVTDEFERRRIRYTRCLRDQWTRGIGLSWQEVFETTDRSQVESHCRRSGADLRWHGDRSLFVSQIGPATVCHPDTGERVWFNQADQFHPTNLGEEAAADLRVLFDDDHLPTNATYGDGGPIDPVALSEIRATADSLALTRPWERGDLLVIDNLLTAHGRRPFTGDRRVLVAMG